MKRPLTRSQTTSRAKIKLKSTTIRLPYSKDMRERIVRKAMKKGRRRDEDKMRAIDYYYE